MSLPPSPPWHWPSFGLFHIPSLLRADTRHVRILGVLWHPVHGVSVLSRQTLVFTCSMLPPFVCWQHGLNRCCSFGGHTQESPSASLPASCRPLLGTLLSQVHPFCINAASLTPRDMEKWKVLSSKKVPNVPTSCCHWAAGLGGAGSPPADAEMLPWPRTGPPCTWTI